MNKATEIMKRFREAKDIETKKLITKELEAYYQGLSVKTEARAEILQQVDARMAEMLNELQEIAKTTLTYQGHNYDLNEWLTIARYAEKYKHTVPRVTNWIYRGIIPPTKKLVIPELNNLTLLHDEQYKE